MAQAFHWDPREKLLFSTFGGMTRGGQVVTRVLCGNGLHRHGMGAMVLTVAASRRVVNLVVPWCSGHVMRCVSLSSAMSDALEMWGQVDLTKFNGRMPRRWEIKIAQETMQRRNLRATMRAMVQLKKQRKAAKEGKPAEDDAAGDETVYFAPVTQEDVLEPARFGGAMQKVHEFGKLVPVVDVSRHYNKDGTCSSTVLMTFYSSE